MNRDQTGQDLGGLDDHSSLVAGPRRLQLTSVQKVGVAGLVAFVFLAFIWIEYALQAKAASKPAELSMVPNDSAFRPAPLLTNQDPAPPPPVTPKPTGEISPEESPIFAYAVSPATSGATPPLGGLGSALTSALPGSSGMNKPAVVAGQVVPPLATNAPDPSNAISSLLKPTVANLKLATLLPHPDMLITKGTIIQCTLQTAVNTELAGFVKCVLPEPVRSTTGNVILLDRGTTVVGEVQQGLEQGRKRVFILWDRAETPQHAIISLASPGADQLGRAGVDGKINNHFWGRFGGALMLSVVDGAVQAGTALAGRSGHGGGTYFNGFQSNTQQVTDPVLERSINIPPTLERAQGGNVSIFVASDIDFSAVYQLAMDK